MANLREDYFLTDTIVQEVSPAGSITLSGALATQENPDAGGNQSKILAGTLTPSGEISEIGIGFSEESGTMAGAIGPIGSLSTNLSTALRTVETSGFIIPAGELHLNRANAKFEGNLNFVGVLNARNTNPSTSLGGTLGLSGAVQAQAIGIALVEVMPRAARILEGATRHFSVKVFDDLGREVLNPDVQWSSSDTLVATVDSNGTVTAIEAGSATIIATVGATVGTAQIQVVEATSDGGTQPRPWGYRKRRYRGRLS